MRIYVIAFVVVSVIGAATAAVNGLISYGKALGRIESQESIIELQKATGELGLVINKTEGDLAEKTRNAQDSEEDRIDAIQTTSLQAEQIADFEALLYTLRQENREQDMLVTSLRNANLRVISVISVDDVERLFESARNSDQLPESLSAGILSKRLSEITGPNLSEVIKYIVGSYNRCAIKYNAAWRSCDRLIESTQDSIASP